jgi:5-methyltetrahydrofolate--homocysteine methyltransferase
MADDLNLSELSLEEIYQQMGDDLYDGYQEEVVEGVQEALSRGITPYGVLTQGLVAGMDIVGQDFRDGILFVPEVLMAANAIRHKLCCVPCCETARR